MRFQEGLMGQGLLLANPREKQRQQSFSLKELLMDHFAVFTLMGLLALASAVCVGMFLIRLHYSDTSRYLGLIWNLFLAWIPLLFALPTWVLAKNGGKTKFLLPIFLFLWLIFFPNAPYILTDFQHLRSNIPTIPVWFDVLLILWFAWTGLLLGIISLKLIQDIVRTTYGEVWSWALVILVSFAGGFGVFLGRFVRLNSWDLFNNPHGVFHHLWGWMAAPGIYSTGFIALYSVLFLMVYAFMEVFTHLGTIGKKA